MNIKKKIIRPDLVKLRNNKNDCKIQLPMQVIFNLTKKFNDKRTLCIKTKNIQVNDNIYELFNLLKKCVKIFLSL